MMRPCLKQVTYGFNAAMRSPILDGNFIKKAFFEQIF